MDFSHETLPGSMELVGPTKLTAVCAPASQAREAIRRDLRRASEWGTGSDDGLDVALAGTVRNFSQGSEIYGDGDEVRSFYRVGSGVVRTCKFLGDGRRQIDGFHFAGEIFGLEIAAEHTLSAEAVTDCAVMAYRWRGLPGIGSRGEPVAQRVFAYAMWCLERAQHHSLLLGRRGAAQRLAAFLTDMAQTEAEETVVDLAMSRQDIADYLGLTVETVSRTLSQFERDRLIALPSARHIVLCNLTALEHLND